MKKILSILIIALMVFSVMPTSQALAADDAVYQENVIDKISDWAATVGKDKAERDRILATRKAERQAKHVKKKAEQMKKKAEKQAGGAKKDMKKKMGM